MEKRLEVIISDLDGTLLNANHALSDYTKEIVRKSSEVLPFWIATGRHHLDASIIKDQLGLQTYIIASNGGTILNPDGSIYLQKTIKKEVVEKLLTIPTAGDVYRNMYQEDLWLMEREDEVFKDFYTANSFKYTLANFDQQVDKPINKVFFTSLNHESLVPIYKAIKENLDEELDLTFSMPVCLEVMPKNTNKGSAILELLDLHGFRPENAVAFGDGMNDLEMLQVVGHGYIMENANIQLKEKLKDCEIIGHHHDDALANTLACLIKSYI